MTPEQFVYWLQGFLELTGTTKIDDWQAKTIKEHLATVFTKVTPAIEYPPRPWYPGDIGDFPGTGLPPVTYCQANRDDSFPATQAENSANMPNLNEYAKEVHAANQKWWQDMNTGSPP